MTRGAAAVGVTIAALAGGAAHAAHGGHRVVVDPAVVSPDGKLRARVKHVFTTQTGSTGYLQVGSLRGRLRAIYRSNDSCCRDVTWASSRLLVFDDDYAVKTVDVWTGTVRRIADFSDFAVSKNGRWVAGWAESGGHSPERIGVVTIAGADCRVVPRPADADDTHPWFSANGKLLFFLRRRFDPSAQTVPGLGRLQSVPLSGLRPLRGGC